MRIIVFFDLPVVEKQERKIYTKFRKFLLRDGYDMLQYSVYCRICNGFDGVEKYTKRLELQLPKKGAIRTMVVTDKQYGNMKVLVGNPTIREKKLVNNQMSIF